MAARIEGTGSGAPERSRLRGGGRRRETPGTGRGGERARTSSASGRAGAASVGRGSLAGRSCQSSVVRAGERQASRTGGRRTGRRHGGSEGSSHAPEAGRGGGGGRGRRRAARPGRRREGRVEKERRLGVHRLFGGGRQSPPPGASPLEHTDSDRSKAPPARAAREDRALPARKGPYSGGGPRRRSGPACPDQRGSSGSRGG